MGAPLVLIHDINASFCLTCKHQSARRAGLLPAPVWSPVHSPGSHGGRDGGAPQALAAVALHAGRAGCALPSALRGLPPRRAAAHPARRRRRGGRASARRARRRHRLPQRLRRRADGRRAGAAPEAGARASYSLLRDLLCLIGIPLASCFRWWCSSFRLSGCDVAFPVTFACLSDAVDFSEFQRSTHHIHICMSVNS
jgi:hypothetical protein